MDEKRRSRRDFRQNIVITLLSLSAVLLFARTQLSDRDLSSYFSSFQDTAIPSGTAIVYEDTVLTAPVRAAVTGSYGRYGSVTLTTGTTSEEFSPLGTLLGQVLGSAQAYTVCTKADFLNALEHPSVYYDFLQPLPLSVLGGFVGAKGTDNISARHLVVTSLDGNQVLLYLWDHAGRFLCGVTALSPQELETIIGGYEQGNAMFAFDPEDRYADYAKSIHPLSLFLPEAQPQPSVLSAATAFSNLDQVLSALGFNPHTKYRWTEVSGTEVITDGDRTLRIRTDGTLSYQSGGSGALYVESATAVPTLWEAASDVSSLLSTLLPAESGAELYLREISRSGEETTLVFDYQYGGVPIRFSSGGHAAKVTLSGAGIDTISFTSRQYVAEDDTAPLLPLPQAMAIAAQNSGAELLIGYADYGEQSVRPQWLTE